MRHPDSEQLWRYGSTLGALVSAAGLAAALGGIGVPSWLIWTGFLVPCAVLALRLWGGQLDHARDMRNRVPMRPAFVDPKDSDPGV